MRAKSLDRMLGPVLLALLVGALAAGFSTASRATESITEEAAHAIGVDAYVYFYPLISMDVTRKQMTNIELGKKFGAGPMNVFSNVPAYPPAEMKIVVRPNFDTLYSVVWLDLTKEPMIVSVPDTGGRFYLLPMLDMWTDVFASPGWRTTGTQAADYAVVAPGWTGDIPAGIVRIDAPTPYVWVIGRTKTDGPADYDAVHKIQAGYKVTPLSNWGKTPHVDRSEGRPERRHEDPAEDAGRHDAGRQVLRLCRRTPEAASAPRHGSADPRADEADRHRARQELRH